MPYYCDHRGFEVHLGEALEASDAGGVTWLVRGYGRDRASGAAPSCPEAFAAACAVIDRIEDDPYRYPINLVGYPEEAEGDVVTRDGEVLGRWRVSDDETLEVVEFIPNGSDGVLFEEHSIGLLCAAIRDWHEGRESQ